MTKQEMQHQLNVQNIQAMPCMQVHARLQHVVMQKYEGKKMRLVEPSMIMSSMPAKRTLKFIEVIVEEDVDGKYRPEKFNLQQTKRKRQKSDGDKRHEVEYSTDDREWQDEKCTRGPTGKSAWTGPPELVKIIEASGVSRVNSQAATGRVKSRVQATTAQSMFMQRCLARMDIVQDCFSERVSTASDDCSAMKKKRKLELANKALHNFASILMDANVMFYSEAMEENDE